MGVAIAQRLGLMLEKLMLEKPEIGVLGQNQFLNR
jgi:hypothetical protein